MNLQVSTKGHVSKLRNGRIVEPRRGGGTVDRPKKVDLWCWTTTKSDTFRTGSISRNLGAEPSTRHEGPNLADASSEMAISDRKRAEFQGRFERNGNFLGQIHSTITLVDQIDATPWSITQRIHLESSPDGDICSSSIYIYIYIVYIVYYILYIYYI